MSSERSCNGQFWAMWADGAVVELGKFSYQPSELDRLTFYDTEAERDAVPEVHTYINQMSLIKNKGLLERFDKTQEYSAKGVEAVEWLENNPDDGLLDIHTATPAQIQAYQWGDYTADKYPWISIEVDLTDVTPRACAESIVAAMKRDEVSERGAWTVAWNRVQLREQIKVMDD